MLYHLLGYMTLLTITVLRRDAGQRVAACLLFGNWALISAFVHFSGCVFPWPWFLTVDWLTALTLYIDRETNWQRALVFSYAVELLLHATFAYVTRDTDASLWSTTDAPTYWRQWWYWHALDTVAWAQTMLLGAWIGYDMARHRRMHRRGISPSVARDGAAS